MQVNALPPKGNSSKFSVVTKNGSFTLTLSYTLKVKIWKLEPEAELGAAQELAEAIVSRHDPAESFRKIYIFAEHNTASTLDATVSRIRVTGF